MVDSVIRAEEIKVLTIDGTTYVVSELSDNVQRLVQIYNQWRQEQVEARLANMKVDLALRGLSADIVNTLRQEQEEAAAKDAPEGSEVPAPEGN